MVERQAGAQTQRLIRLHLPGEIEDRSYRQMTDTLKEELSAARLLIEALSHNQEEIAEVTIELFEFSQCLENKWLATDISTKRTLLEFLRLNFSSTDASLCMTMNKPFDIIAEGLTVYSGRGDWI